MNEGKLHHKLKTHISEAVSDWEYITYVADAVHYMGESEYQKILVFESKPFGKILMLDHAVQFTERDEFIYHEMLAHVPMLAHPAPRNVLIVGGGDGGAAREALRHPSVERLELCEIDQAVVDVCRKHFPTVSSSFDDPRLHLNVGDGIARLKEVERGSLDVVLVDGTDPNPFAAGLYGAGFYESVHGALGPRGVLATVAGSPFFIEGWTRGAFRAMAEVFPHVALYTAVIPTYPGFLWAFCLGSKEPRADGAERLGAFEKDLQYLDRDLLGACFALPRFVRTMIEE